MGVLLHGAGYVEAMDQKNSIEEQLFGLSQFKIPFFVIAEFLLWQTCSWVAP